MGGDRELETTTLVKAWTNTDPSSHGIVNVQLRSIAGGLRVTIHGAAGGSLINWGETAVEALYAENPASKRGIAFIARYNFGFIETLVEGNVNSGLLVLAAFHTFLDGSRRANYFSR